MILVVTHVRNLAVLNHAAILVQNRAVILAIIADNARSGLNMEMLRMKHKIPFSVCRIQQTTTSGKGMQMHGAASFFGEHKLLQNDP